PPGRFARWHHAFDHFLDYRVTRTYSRGLVWALRHRFGVLSVVALLFVGSLFLTLGIGREFYPQVDAGQITVYVRCPSNLRLDASEERIKEVEKKIIEKEKGDGGVIPKDDVDMVVTELGLDPDWSAAYTANSGQQDAVIRIQLTPERKKSSQEYAIALRHA